MNIRRKGLLTILEPGDPANGFSALDDQLSDLAHIGDLWVVIDMRGIDSLPEFAAGEMVVAAAALMRAGGVVKLANVCPSLYAILEATRLTTVFEIFPDEESAVRSFDQALAVRSRAAWPRSELFWG